MDTSTPERTELNRRTFLWMALHLPPALLLVGCGAEEISDTVSTQVTAIRQTAPTAIAATQVAQLPPTPACGDDDDDPTPAQTEGPFYTPNTPERTSFLEAGITGTHMLVTGTVLATDCLPIAGALLDFWHADDGGVYDNEGFRLRGHQFADENGRFTLETIMPGLYPGRTRHFHVKVQAPNQPVLTTQLYFPDEPDNATDGIFNADLLMDIEETTQGKLGTFNFVLNT